MEKELLERLLNIFQITGMLDNDIRHKNDGKSSYCDNEYYRGRQLLQTTTREILKKEDKE